MSQYRYMEFELIHPGDVDIEVTWHQLREILEKTLLNFYGTVNGLAYLDFMGFEKLRKRTVLRIRREYLSRIRTAVAFIDKYQDTPCTFALKQISKEPITL